jgi:hypothetical protein
MNNWDSRYAERVKLLVEILPTLAKEKRFALKGGTAINLFEHDLPRLSVDIDLTWLPVGDFASDTRDIAVALEAIGEQLRSGPMRLQVQTSGTEVTGVHRLIASRNRARVQIETTPVMRGTVHPVRTMRVRPGVEQNFRIRRDSGARLRRSLRRQALRSAVAPASSRPVRHATATRMKSASTNDCGELSSSTSPAARSRQRKCWRRRSHATSR